MYISLSSPSALIFPMSTFKLFVSSITAFSISLWPWLANSPGGLWCCSFSRPYSSSSYAFMYRIMAWPGPIRPLKAPCFTFDGVYCVPCPFISNVFLARLSFYSFYPCENIARGILYPIDSEWSVGLGSDALLSGYQATPQPICAARRFSLPRLMQLFHQLEQSDAIGSKRDRRITGSFSVLVYIKAILSFPLRASLHLLSSSLRRT